MKSSPTSPVKWSFPTPDSLYSHIRTGREIPEAGPQENIIKKQTTTLTEILDHHLEKGQVIDLLSIDTEGHDLAVLKSLDLGKYKPGFIVIEDLGLLQNGIPDKEIPAYLDHWKYKLVSQDAQNLYFKVQAQ